MEPFIFGALTGFTLIAFGVLIVFIILGIYKMAERDLFFTLIEEGQAKIVVRGKSYHRTIISLKGYELDGEGDVVPIPIPTDETRIEEEGRAEKKKKRPWSRLLDRLTGIYWVGIYPFYKVHEYEFRWASLEQEVNKAGQIIQIPKFQKERVRSIFLKDDVFTGSVDDEATQDNIRVAVSYVVTASISNPYKATFSVQHWLEQLHAQVTQSLRSYIGSKTHDELKEKEVKPEGEGTTEDISKQGFSSWLKNKGITDEMEEKFGVKINNVNLFSIDPVGELKKMFIEAQAKKYVADQEAQRLKAEAGGQAEAYKILANAIKAGGESGRLASQLVTLERMSAGPATKFFFPAEIMSLMQGGKKLLDDLGQKEDEK